MNKEAAIYDFMSSFYIPAYPSAAVPDNAAMPYITYTLVIGDFDNPVSMSANVWYRTESEAAINAKVREISKALSNGGRKLYYDDDECTRAVWLTKGTPWAQAVDDEDNTVKRRYLNIELKYMEL